MRQQDNKKMKNVLPRLFCGSRHRSSSARAATGSPLLHSSFFILLLFMVACSDDPAADRVAGSYNCNAKLYTRVKVGSQWRDTAFVSKAGNSVVLTKISDDKVAVKLSSNKWGVATADTAWVSDFNSSANISGDGTYEHNNRSYATTISGTAVYDPKGITISARVTDYPGSGGKYILTLTTASM
jgi:hypothetical protein